MHWTLGFCVQWPNDQQETTGAFEKVNIKLASCLCLSVGWTRRMWKRCCLWFCQRSQWSPKAQWNPGPGSPPVAVVAEDRGGAVLPQLVAVTLFESTFLVNECLEYLGSYGEEKDWQMHASPLNTKVVIQCYSVGGFSYFKLKVEKELPSFQKRWVFPLITSIQHHWQWRLGGITDNTV